MADTIRIKALNLGSCNGCDIEILDLFRREPKFSAVENEVEADVLLVAGSLTPKT